MKLRLFRLNFYTCNNRRAILLYSLKVYWLTNDRNLNEVKRSTRNDKNSEWEIGLIESIDQFIVTIKQRIVIN